MEIERKFLIDGFPDLPPVSEKEVEQGYLCTDPVVRIRCARAADRTDYVLCFKGEGTLAREEIELPLDGGTYTRLAGLLKAPLIRKTYKTYALPDGHRLEVSLVDEGAPSAFFYAEVEFDSVEEAKAFVPPPFLGRDVTEEPGFGMSDYWNRRVSPVQKANDG